MQYQLLLQLLQKTKKACDLSEIGAEHGLKRVWEMLYLVRQLLETVLSILKNEIFLLAAEQPHGYQPHGRCS